MVTVLEMVTALSDLEMVTALPDLLEMVTALAALVVGGLAGCQ